MRFVMLIGPQLLLAAYSKDTLSKGEPPNLRYVFKCDGEGNHELESRSFALQRAKYDSRFELLDDGYVEVTEFATKASTFEGHLRALLKIDGLFRRYWNQGVMVDEVPQYANPLNVMLRWAREQPGIGAPGQAELSLHLIPLSRHPPGPSKYDFCQ